MLNSSGGIVALYVFLTAAGFSLFVIFVVGPLYRKLCVHTNSFEDGPSPLLMTITLMIVLLCAFVTDIIGVHAIFGGFLAGVIIPHEHDLSIKITEKIEDMINIIFLPLVSIGLMPITSFLVPQTISLNVFSLLVFHFVWSQDSDWLVGYWYCVGLCHFGHFLGLFW